MFNKLIVILGPTASGKSSLAIKLARKFNGEIISADSRQVYTGMDIGTGKVPISHGGLRKTSAKSSIPSNDGIYSGGIRHHLLNIASPKKQFTVSDFKLHTKKAIAKIVGRGKFPFLVGGTAFYIYAVIDDWQIPEVKPNLKLRKKLAKKTAKELYVVLKKLDPKRAKAIDRHNPARLIRAIEIVKATGKPVPPPPSLPHQGGGTNFPPPRGEGLRAGKNLLILGVKKSPSELRKLINKRVDQRFKQGLIKEVRKLLRSEVNVKRLKQIGLTYGLVANYLKSLVYRDGRSTESVYKELVQKVKIAEWQFARRQMTWFKRDKRIKWVKNQTQAEELTREFLSS